MNLILTSHLGLNRNGRFGLKGKFGWFCSFNSLSINPSKRVTWSNNPSKCEWRCYYQAELIVASSKGIVFVSGSGLKILVATVNISGLNRHPKCAVKNTIIGLLFYFKIFEVFLRVIEIVKFNVKFSLII